MWLKCCLTFFLCLINTVKLDEPSVIIIGAGPAGIAAASKLIQNNINNVTILEAENRFGGRIHSVSFGNAFGDLGAEFCHGEKYNVVYEMVKDLELLDTDFNSSNVNIFYSNGSKFDNELSLELVELILNFEDIEDDISYNITDKSLKELFSYRLNTTLLKKYENNDDILKVLKDGVEFGEGLAILNEGSHNLSEVSAQSDFQICEGRQDLIWKGTGYKVILDILMKKYPEPSKKLPIEDKLHFNFEVTKIFWNQKKTTVLTADNQTFSADYVIFTPSLGVLKWEISDINKDKIFNPILPIRKKNSIESIGFKGVIKVFIHFPEKWWNDEDTDFLFYWSQGDAEETLKINNLSWVTQIKSLTKQLYLPNWWTMWIGGEYVSKIEQLPLETLKQGCRYVFDKFLSKNYNVSEIGEIIVSNWNINKHFRGTYSFPKVGQYRKGLSHQKILAEPLKNTDGKPVILFAGEATHHKYYATVHGAIESGFREAQRIVDYTKINIRNHQ